MINPCNGIWTQQEGDDLKLIFYRKIEDQASDAIAFNFACEIVCLNTWKDLKSHEIDFDRFPKWESATAKTVDFDFVCEVEPECLGLWEPRLGNDVNLSLKPEWEPRNGNKVDISFKCEGGTDPGFVYFEGLIDFVDGQTFDLDIQETLLTRFYTGQYVESDLSVFPAEGFGLIDNKTGESLVSELATDVSIPVDYRIGEVVNFGLSTEITFDDISVYSSENLNVVLTEAPVSQLSVTFTLGENAEVAISTSVLLEDVSVRTGEEFIFDFEEHPSQNLEADFYDGQFFDPALSSDVRLSFRAYSGAEFTPDITINPKGDLSGNGYAGETFAATVSFASNLGDSEFASGESLEVDLDSLEFFDFFTGETSEASLATETTMSPVGRIGETALVDLLTGPSEPIGQFYGYTGATLDAVVATLESVTLYPNLIRATQWMNCEFSAITSFDLNTVGCCPVQDSHEHIELNDMPAQDEKYSGDKTIFEAGLSAYPRFQISFRSGETFTHHNPNYLGLFVASDGQSIQNWDLREEVVNFPLCRGNLIPSGDYVEIELMSEYGECEADMFYTGESVQVDISNNITFDLPAYTGEYASSIIAPDPAILPYFYTGEHVRVQNIDLEVRFPTDSILSFDFEGDKYLAGDGARVETNLVIEYDVEFDEFGCLDNEFVPSNENGDPDWDKFNRVPVEMDMYVHSIKARCF